MNLYKERMAEESRKLIEENNEKYEPNINNKKNINDINQINSLNDIGANHSGVTLQKFNKPSQKQNSAQQKNKFYKFLQKLNMGYLVIKMRFQLIIKMINLIIKKR